MRHSPARINKRQSVTIKEVAEHAGVSLMTVSRVLNKQSVVREETRARVERAMQELNYRPNMLARGLAGGNSIFIGLVHANPSDGYLSEFLVGALNSCREAGHHLVLEDLTIDGALPGRADVEAHLRQIGLDGIIVTPPLSENREVVDALRQMGIPYVLVADGFHTEGEMSIGINDADAAEAMTRHLIDLGHRRIGFIVGAEDQSSSALRQQGFLTAMEKAGLEVRDTDIVRGAFTYRSGMQAAETLLRQDDRPTAVFASNDDMAAGVIATAHQLGLKIPQDLSVAGFDDTPIASAIWPQLTTVRQPIADMARAAVTALSEVVTPGGHKTSPDHQILEIALIERETVAPPATGD